MRLDSSQPDRGGQSAGRGDPRQTREQRPSVRSQLRRRPLVTLSVHDARVRVPTLLVLACVIACSKRETLSPQADTERAALEAVARPWFSITAARLSRAREPPSVPLGSWERPFRRRGRV